MSLTVCFTGGGTAGHVTPNIALIEAAEARGWQVFYVGAADGIEARMIPPMGVTFYPVASGKLRRYFSWQNFVDPFKVVWGICQSLRLLIRNRPDAVFSKGGFVSVPVVIAAWLLRIPVISHESDVTPGLANRLTYPFCRRLCVTFEETLPYLRQRFRSRTLVTGTPLRQSLVQGDADRGLAYLGFTGEKPVLLVFGGSLGAAVLNRQVRAVLNTLLDHCDVVHIAGEAGASEALAQPGYRCLSFVGEEFGDVLAAADVVVARAGANSLYELLYTRKPHLLVPLSLAASRGDQIVNARVFEKRGFSRVLDESELTDEAFVSAIRGLIADRDRIADTLSEFEARDSLAIILETIQSNA